MKERKIKTATELRGVLLASIEALLEGRLNVQMANSVANLSGEFHKSINQQWDMAVYANENLNLKSGEVIKILGITDENDSDEKNPSLVIEVE